MIDPKTAYVGMKVRCLSDNRVGVITDIKPDDTWPVGVALQGIEDDRCMWKSLDPIDPPAPQRVEVVTETREVPVAVVLKMTIEEAKAFTDFICKHELMNRLQDDVQAALAAQEAK